LTYGIDDLSLLQIAELYCIVLIQVGDKEQARRFVNAFLGVQRNGL
jgi:hypothetical protein